MNTEYFEWSSIEMEIDVVRNSERIYYRFEEVPAGGIEVPMLHEQDLPTEILPEESPVTPPKPGFWRRQFGENVTGAQRKFDWIMGVGMPLICFYFDPFVFRSARGMGEGELSLYGPAAYMLAFASILAMVAWLLWGERLKWLNGWIGGLFIAGSVISLIVGILLFPISLIGLIVLIGALGFTPLFASLVYMRNGVRALRASSSVMEKGVLVNVAVLSGMIAIAVPYLAQDWWR